MISFAGFEPFIRCEGQASIVLSVRAVEPALDLKRARLDGSIVDAFEHRLRELAAGHWSGFSATFARVVLEIDPAGRDVLAEIDRFLREFSEQASTLADAADEAVADAGR